MLYLLDCAGCIPDATTGPLAPPSNPEVASGLEGTVWAGEFDHANAEGGPTHIVWYFLANGKLRQVRDDGQVIFGTVTVEGNMVVVDCSVHGAIDLVRTGDTLTGVTRFRSGYGYGWEYELRLKK